MDVVATKKAGIVRIYLPPDANTLLSVTDHCLRSRNYVNVITAGKQLAPNWLNIEDATRHCTSGLGIWDWACANCGADDDPEVILACAGDVPTLETLAAVTVLRDWRRTSVSASLMLSTCSPLNPTPPIPTAWARLSSTVYSRKTSPSSSRFHGYPQLIHTLTYSRTNHSGFHVHGFKEEGTTTTPFDMVVLNELDRYSLALDAISRVPRMQPKVAEFEQRFSEIMEKHKLYVTAHGEDMPEIVIGSGVRDKYPRPVAFEESRPETRQCMRARVRSSSLTVAHLR